MKLFASVSMLECNGMLQAPPSPVRIRSCVSMPRPVACTTRALVFRTTLPTAPPGAPMLFKAEACVAYSPSEHLVGQVDV